MIRSLVKFAAFAAVAGVAALALLEVGLRVADFSYPSLITTDDVTGRWHRPGVEGTYRYEGVATARTNSKGLRDREHALEKPLDAFRIAVLGDAFAEAFHVEEDEAFWAVLRDGMDACGVVAPRDVEMLNFGIGGFGTAQELLTWRHRAKHYDPDLVLLAFFPGDDLTNDSRDIDDGANPLKPYFELRDGALHLDDRFKDDPVYQAKNGAPYRWIRRASDLLRVVQFANFSSGEIAHWVRGDKPQPTDADPNPEPSIPIEIYREPTDPVWRDAWALSEALIAQTHAEVVAAGASFLLVTPTTGIQVHPDPAVRQRFVDHFGLRDAFYPNARIAALAEREGFDYLHLGPSMAAYAEANGAFLHGFENTAPGIGRWNAEGHRVAGERIADHLCRS